MLYLCSQIVQRVEKSVTAKYCRGKSATLHVFYLRTSGVKYMKLPVERSEGFVRCPQGLKIITLQPQCIELIMKQ